jgi:hypothetical protein
MLKFLANSQQLLVLRFEFRGHGLPTGRVSLSDSNLRERDSVRGDILSTQYWHAKSTRTCILHKIWPTRGDYNYLCQLLLSELLSRCPTVWYLAENMLCMI